MSGLNLGLAPDGVRQERTGWRDQEISARHRQWGFNCPGVDLDFVIAEYHIGKPVGIVEYKHHFAQMPSLQHPTYRALKELADGYREPLPFLVSFYWPRIWAFRIYPVNEIANNTFRWGEGVTEHEYVRRLYRLRRLTLTRALEGKLLKVLPPEAAQ
ncbi:MAG: hypothetical protein ACR2RF_06115 [Geminicoccaceae bacterium]